MSIQLELPPELESQLSTEAVRLNLSLSEYILRVLSIGKVLIHYRKLEQNLLLRNQYGSLNVFCHCDRRESNRRDYDTYRLSQVRAEQLSS